MRIVVDMDEVLVEFVDAVLKRWNKENGTSWKRNDINAWQMESTLGPGSYGVIEKWISEPYFFESLEPKPDAIEGFKSLIEMGHDVVIATSLAPDVESGYDSKRRWMKKHFPNFDLKNFICTSRKELLHADVLIDDAAHYLQAWNDENPKRRSIVVDAPWNKKIDFAVRVENWKQISSIIRVWQLLDEVDFKLNIAG